MSFSLLTIGIVGLIISVIVLTVLFMFLKIAFWIGLVVTMILAGVWVYFYFFKNKEIIEEEFASNISKDATVALHTATDADMAALQRLGELKQGKLSINDANINGKLFFKDPSMSPQPNGANSTDPYYIERLNTGGDQSSLRLTMNDNTDESLEIWGNSCALGNCNGPGAMQHKFQADGQAWHNNNINTKGDFVFNGDNGWILHTPDDGRKTMYVAPMSKNGWDWGKGFNMNNNGYLDVNGGGINLRGGTSEHNPGWQTHFPWVGDNKNYIRGDTVIHGNTNNVGDLTAGRDFYANKLKLSSQWSGYPDNVKDQSEISNDTNSFKQLMIVGNRSAGGPRTVGIWDKLNVNGDLSTGNIDVGGGINMNNGTTLYNKGRQHIHGEENLFLLNKGGVYVSKAWGGNGNLNVDGNLCVQNTCISGADLQNMLKKSKT